MRSRLLATTGALLAVLVAGPGHAQAPKPDPAALGKTGILERLAERSGREAGEFHWLHQLSADSRGNIYTAEVDNGKRIQKFIRYGDAGCSGTGRTTVGGVLQ